MGRCSRIFNAYWRDLQALITFPPIDSGVDLGDVSAKHDGRLSLMGDSSERGDSSSQSSDGRAKIAQLAERNESRCNNSDAESIGETQEGGLIYVSNFIILWES